MKKLSLTAVAILAICAVSVSISAAPASKKAEPASTISQSVYGYLPDGEMVTEYVLTNSHGLEAKVITYGGIITSLKVPDKKGVFADVVLGYDTLEEYTKGTRFFGALIGRYGNRIAKGQFTLEGKKYQLPTNDGANHLHGGFVGFDKRNWHATAFKKDGDVGLKLSLLSKDGDQGYPGNLTVEVEYTLNNYNEFVVNYTAYTDRPTLVNLTQHSYFNLSGKGDILNHQLKIYADFITPVDKGLIPDGSLTPVAGTPFDFRKLTTIGSRINDKNQQLEYGKGYDHNFALDKSKMGVIERAAKLVDPESGRVMELLTSEPALQFYSGNFLDGSDHGKGLTYGLRSGLCLEPQHAPDSPNKPSFPSTVLKPGEVYRSTMGYRFSVLTK